MPVDNVGGGVRSARRNAGVWGGVVTQATGHHRSYWFVVSLVLQRLSLSLPPRNRVIPLSLPYTWAHTGSMWRLSCVSGLLCARICVWRPNIMCVEYTFWFSAPWKYWLDYAGLSPWVLYVFSIIWRDENFSIIFLVDNICVLYLLIYMKNWECRFKIIYL